MRKTIPILLLTGWILTACSSPEADIEVASAFDMGTVVKGEMAVAELPVRNLGDGPLTVLAVSTSCGCTKATVSPMTIPPGNEASLRIEYDSNAHKAELGSVDRFVFISSNDPDERDVSVKITVFVKAKAS